MNRAGLASQASTRGAASFSTEFFGVTAAQYEGPGRGHRRVSSLPYKPGRMRNRIRPIPTQKTNSADFVSAPSNQANKPGLDDGRGKGSMVTFKDPISSGGNNA